MEGAETSFSLSFTVPDYLTGKEVEYSFILEGYDNQWTSFSSINEASYTDVPAGDYILKSVIRKTCSIRSINSFHSHTYSSTVVSVAMGLSPLYFINSALCGLFVSFTS